MNVTSVHNDPSQHTACKVPWSTVNRMFPAADLSLPAVFAFLFYSIQLISFVLGRVFYVTGLLTNREHSRRLPDSRKEGHFCPVMCACAMNS